jgi:hypothetical protein
VTIKTRLDGHEFDLQDLADWLPAGNIRVAKDDVGYYQGRNQGVHGFGRLARCQWHRCATRADGGGPPKRTMTELQAREFISRLLRAWMDTLKAVWLAAALH